MSHAHYARIADRYDAIVQTRTDIPFFLAEARKSPGEMLELMAGTGRVSIPLVEAGAHLTCVDFAPEMLARLRDKLARRGLVADVRQMDVRDLDLGKRYELIIIPFHAFPELTSTQDQSRALERIHAHLEDSGRFVCTLHNPRIRVKTADGRYRLAGKYPFGQGLLFVWLLEMYERDSNIVEVLEFFEEYDAQGVMCSRSWSEVSFHLLEKSAFESLIAAAGFTVDALYGDYSYAPFDEETSPFMIWVLRKDAS